MGRPRGGSGSYGLRRRSGPVVNPMLYNTGVELMMECFEDVLSPSQIEATRKAKEEHKKAQKQIEEAKAEAARAAAAAAAKAEAERQAAAKAEAERQAAAKAEAERQAAEAAAAAAMLLQSNNAKNSGSSSPDIMIVGESPPRMVAPRPGMPMPMSGPIINTIATRGVLPPHAAGMPQELYRFPAQGQNASAMQNNQWYFRPLRPGAPHQPHQAPGKPATPGAPKQPGTPGGPNVVTIVSGTSGLGIKRAFNSLEEAMAPAPANKKQRGRFVSDTNNGSGGNWVPLDEYYYGKMEGDPTFLEEKSEFRFRCWICTKMLYNNVKAMMHLQGHIDSEKQQNLDLSDLTQCKHCYKQFDTPFEMQTHIEKVHLSNMNVLMCRICEKDHESRGALTNHMRQNHCACEMPYTCQLCHFRSSMYSDVVDHFKKKHDSSDSMLCLYCLRVFHVKFVSQGWGQTQVFYHHLLRHQSRSSNRKCTYCKLSFFNAQDMKNHRRTHHQPNTRGVIGLNQKQSQSDQVMIKVPEAGIMSSKQGGGPKSLNAPTVSKVLEHRGLHLPQPTAQSYCFECRMLMNTTDHYKKYIQCSMCRFATSCSFAYATHMMGFHSGQPEALSRSVPTGRPLSGPLYCSCGFASKFGNKIANHLVFCSKRTSYLNKPEAPPVEKPALDEIDPRHKPDASILDVLGLVKKQVVNPSVGEDKARAKPEVQNIPDTDDRAKFTSFVEESKLKMPSPDQDKEAEISTSLTTPPAATYSRETPDADTSVFQTTSSMDTDLTAVDPSLEGGEAAGSVREEGADADKAAQVAAECSAAGTASEEHKQPEAGDSVPPAEDCHTPENAAAPAEDLQAPETEDAPVPQTEDFQAPEDSILQAEDLQEAPEDSIPQAEAPEDSIPQAEDIQAPETEDAAAPAEDLQAPEDSIPQAKDLQTPETEDSAAPVAEDNATQETENVADAEKDLAGSEAENAEDSKSEDRAATEESAEKEEASKAEEESSEHLPGDVPQGESMETEEDFLGHADTDLDGKAVEEQDGAAHPEEESMDTEEALVAEGEDTTAQEDSCQQALTPLEDEVMGGDEPGKDLNKTSTQDEDLTAEQEEELLGTSKDTVSRQEDALSPELDFQPSAESDAVMYEGGKDEPSQENKEADGGVEAPTVDEDLEGAPRVDQDGESEEKTVSGEAQEMIAPDIDQDGLSEDKTSLSQDKTSVPEEEQEMIPETKDEQPTQGDLEAVSEEPEDTVQEPETSETAEAQTGGEEGEETSAQEPSQEPSEAPSPEEKERDQDTNEPDLSNDQEDTKKDDSDNISKEANPEEDSTNTESKSESWREERKPESTTEDKGNDGTSGDASSSAWQPAPEESADTEPHRGAGDGGSRTGVDPPRWDSKTGATAPSWQPAPQPGQPEESADTEPHRGAGDGGSRTGVDPPRGDSKTGATAPSWQPAPEESANTESQGGAGDGGSRTGVEPPRGDSKTGAAAPTSWQPTPQPGQPEERDTVRKDDREKREEHRPAPAPPSSAYPDTGRGGGGHGGSSSQYPPRPYHGSSSSSSDSRDRQHHSRDYDHRDRDRSHDRNRGYNDHRDYRRDRDRDHHDRHHQYDRHRDQRNDSQQGRYQQGGYGSQDRYNQNQRGNRGGQNRHGYNDRNNYNRGYY